MTTKVFYRIKLNDKILIDPYKTLEEVEKTARELCESCKYENVSIILVKQEMCEVKKLERTPLYKMF